MRNTIMASLLGGCLVTMSASAQITNAPVTAIETLELQTNTVIVKGFGPTGSVSVGDGTISVRRKESTDFSTGRRLYALLLDFTENGRRARAIVDYVELDSMLKGIDFIRNVTYDITTMPGFEAYYTTKSGWRVSAFCTQRQSGIQMFMEFADGPRLSFNLDQLTQLRNLIQQAKNSLDGLHAGK